ncbi:MAG: 2-phosphosulfolactate phosphatase [Planctomycetaceae bacterium]
MTSGLPILNHRSPEAARGSIAATAVRCGGVLLLAMAVRLLSSQIPSEFSAMSGTVRLADVQQLLPAATELKPSGAAVQALAADGTIAGYVITTLPAAKDITGFRGPSNVMLLLNDAGEVRGAMLLNSQDTPEHADAILRSPDFFRQFIGWKMGATELPANIDAVTGATLTSMAIAEGIAVRLGAEKSSLRFPDVLNADDLKLIFDQPEQFIVQPVTAVEALVKTPDGVITGRLVRTGPLVDSVPGYQGPSEVLIYLDRNSIVQKVALRRTWDNQPYAGYLNEDTWFWKVFQNRTLPEIRALDLEAEQVEGVSGATMTSLAVARTLVEAAEKYAQQSPPGYDSFAARTIRFSANDVGSLLVVVGGMTIGFSRLRGHRRLHRIWNVVLVVYFGLVTGNFVSLAILQGWAVSGIAWHLAPGLSAVVIVSLLLPPVTRRNLYCSHLCPHGAAQQLLKPKAATAWSLSSKATSILKFIPGFVLTVAAAVTVFGWSGSLADWEPFNGWIWYVAGISSLLLAAGSLLVSVRIPMAWCRYGCATGRLLDFIHSSRSAWFTLADGVLVILNVIAWTRWLTQALTDDADTSLDYLNQISPSCRSLFIVPELFLPEQLTDSVAVIIDVPTSQPSLTRLTAVLGQVIPCGSIDEALKLRDGFPVNACLLGGERGGKKIDGFDFGNSPGDYTSQSAAGKIIGFTTTNGTKALLRSKAASEIAVAAFVNLSEVSDRLQNQSRPIHLICAGTNGQVTSEDVLFAGALAADLLKRQPNTTLNDSAQIAVSHWRSECPNGTANEAESSLRRSQGGRNLIALGYDEDIKTAAAIDAVPVVGRVTSDGGIRCW